MQYGYQLIWSLAKQRCAFSALQLKTMHNVYKSHLYPKLSNQAYQSEKSSVIPPIALLSQQKTKNLELYILLLQTAEIISDSQGTDSKCQS